MRIMNASQYLFTFAYFSNFIIFRINLIYPNFEKELGILFQLHKPR